MFFQSHSGMNGTGGARHVYDPNDGTYGGAHHAYDPNDGTYGAYNPNDAYDATIYGYGATTGQLVQGTGKDFNCNTFICFGIGATNDNLFKSLQQKINQLAKPGTKPLLVDGFIGPATVTALRAVNSSITFTTKEQVGANAPTIVAILDGQITQRTVALQTGASNQPLAPTGTPVTFTPPTPQAVAAATQTVATKIATGELPSSGAAASLAVIGPKKSNMLLFVLGGLAAVVAVGGVGYYVYRRKAQREG